VQGMHGTVLFVHLPASLLSCLAPRLWEEPRFRAVFQVELHNLYLLSLLNPYSHFVVSMFDYLL